MIGSILSIAAAVFGFISDLIGWRRDQQMKQEGRDEQSLSDLSSANKEDSDAQKVDASVAGESRDDLVRELRGPSAT